MKKKYIALIVLAAAAIVMIAGYFIIAALTKEPEPEEEIIFFTDSITELTVKYDGEEMTFSKKNGEWVYLKDENFPLNTAYLRDMNNALLSVVATGRIESDDLAEFGLDDPDCEIYAKTGDGKTFTCLLGDKNDTANVVYVLYNGSIYTVDDGFSKKFRHSFIEMARKDELIDVQASEVENVEITNSSGTFSLTKEPKYLELEWKTDGIYADTTEVKRLVDAVASLKATESLVYAPDDMTLERYSIGEASVVLTAKDGRKAQVRFGKSVSDGSVIGYVVETDLICAFKEQDTLAVTAAKKDDFLNRVLLPVAYSEDGSAEITAYGKTVKYDFSDYESCWDFYYKLSTIRADAFAKEMPLGSDVKVTVKAGGEEFEINLVKYNSDFYAADVLGTVKLINKRDVEELLTIAEIRN